MVKDQIGNELKVGDLIHYEHSTKLLMAKVVSISDGGLIVPSRLDPTAKQSDTLVNMGQVVIMIQVVMLVDPRVGIVNCFKLTKSPAVIQAEEVAQQTGEKKPN